MASISESLANVTRSPHIAYLSGREKGGTNGDYVYGICRCYGSTLYSNDFVATSKAVANEQSVLSE